MIIICSGPDAYDENEPPPTQGKPERRKQPQQPGDGANVAGQPTDEKPVHGNALDAQRSKKVRP